MKPDVAIIGAGYVGVPLAQVFAEAGRRVVLVDVQQSRVDMINRGESYIEDVPARRDGEARRGRAVGDDRLRRPARGGRDPDRAADAVVAPARAGSVHRARAPSRRSRRGCARGIWSCSSRRRIRARRGRRSSRCSSRPGWCAARTSSSRSRRSASTPAAPTSPRRTSPRSSAGSRPPAPSARPRCTAARSTTVHRVSTPEAAELTKLLENIFRSVNIALVNELAILCDRMSIDIWEVVGAAATKPFGFMPFSPGPGLGGHCIPIDPFYLTWKAREFGFYTEFIELAGKVNEEMPYFCRSLVSQALNHAKRALAEGLEGADPRRRVQARHRRHARVAGAEADLAAAERGRRRRLPRPARAPVRGARPDDGVGAAGSGRARRRRDRHRPPLDRLRQAGRGREPRSSTCATPPARSAPRRPKVFKL